MEDNENDEYQESVLDRLRERRKNKMSSKLNRTGYQQLIKEDLEWLLQQSKTLERDHIEVILKDSERMYYDQ